MRKFDIYACDELNTGPNRFIGNELLVKCFLVTIAIHLILIQLSVRNSRVDGKLHANTMVSCSKDGNYPAAPS